MKYFPAKLQVQKMVLAEPPTTSVGLQLCGHCRKSQQEKASRELLGACTEPTTLWPQLLYALAPTEDGTQDNGQCRKDTVLPRQFRTLNFSASYPGPKGLNLLLVSAQGSMKRNRNRLFPCCLTPRS